MPSDQESNTNSVAPKQSGETEVPVESTLSQGKTNTPKHSLLKKHRTKASLLTIGLVAAVVLLGGSAGAYYGIILPNKPENVLRSALENSLKQKKAKFAGKISYETTDAGADIKAVNIQVDGQSDAEKGAFSAAAEISAAGVNVPFEIRTLDQDIYLKIGDLTSVKGLATAASPELMPLVDQVASKLTNQWLVIDDTLLKQASAGCSLDSSFALTQADVDLLMNRYKEVPFASVKSSRDTVDGRAAFRYEIEADDNKLAEYSKGLNELSIVKKINQCVGSNQESSLTSLADNDKTPVTIWVDKATKQIVKIVSHSTAQDEQKDHFKASLEFTFRFGEATITKPDGARPLMEVLGEFSNLFIGDSLAN